MDVHTGPENATLGKLVDDLMAKILCFPVPTIAAINGHFCAAGGMMGLCFDYRIMNSEKGFFFVPGVDLGIVYSPFQTAMMMAKLPVSCKLCRVI
jgi:enoyl-CoA hydratase/carnithine racemase